MTKIKNKMQLIENGKTKNCRKAKEIALNSLEFALNSVDPKILIKKKLYLAILLFI